MVNNILQEVKNLIAESSKYSKENSDDYGEVFTPFHLIEDMLDLVDEEDWSNPSVTFYDPCAGRGNFPILIIERLMKGLEKVIENEKERLNHIVTNQLFMSEFQEDSFLQTKSILSKLSNKLNFLLGDSLTITSTEFGIGRFTYTITNPPYQSAETRKRIFHKFLDHTNSFSDKQIYVIPCSWVNNKTLYSKYVNYEIKDVRYYPRDIFTPISLRYDITVVSFRTKEHQKAITVTAQGDTYEVKKGEAILNATQSTYNSIVSLLEYDQVDFILNGLEIPRDYRTDQRQEVLPDSYSIEETDEHKYLTRLYLSRPNLDIYCSTLDEESYRNYSVCFGLVNGVGTIAGVYVLPPGLQPCGNIYRKNFKDPVLANKLANYLTSDFFRNVIKHTKTNDVLNGQNNVLKYITSYYETI
jgi:hypothetical protein